MPEPVPPVSPVLESVASEIVAPEPEVLGPDVSAPAASEVVAPEPVAAGPQSIEPLREPAPPPEIAPPPSPESAVDLPAPPLTAPVPQVPSAATGGPQEPSGAGDAELLRRRWAEVLGTLERRRVTWVLVSQSAQVARVEGAEVHLAFASPQLAERFNGGQHAENVALAIRETLGLEVRVIGEADGASASPSRGASAPAPTRLASAPRDVAATEDEASDGDVAAPDAHLTGPEVIAHMLGGTIVEDA